MTAMELNTLKNDFVSDFLSQVNTVEEVSRLKKYMVRILKGERADNKTAKSPVAFSLDELNSELDKSEEDIRCGRVYSQEQMDQFFDSLV